MNCLRTLRISFTLGGMLSYNWLSVKFPSLWSEKFFISTISALGPLITKLGQILSVRPDLCGSILSNRLTNLRSHVSLVAMEFPSREYLRGIPYSADGDEFFTYLDENPIACGSIAQIYKGAITAADSKVVPVICKVIKPGVVARINTDLAILKSLAAIVDYFRPLWKVSLCLKQLSCYIVRQLDFNIEMDNMELFRSEGYNIPLIYRSLSNSGVLCMEYIESIPETLSPESKKTAFCQLGNKMLARGKKGYLLHLDLHPGNILWSVAEETIRIFLIDMGLVHIIEDAVYRKCANAVHTIMSRRIDAYAALFYVDQNCDRDSWHEFIRTLFYVEGREVLLNSNTILSIFVTTVNSCYKYGIALDATLSGMVMALTIINGHYNELAGADANFFEDMLLDN